jgi:rubrerythrin
MDGQALTAAAVVRFSETLEDAASAYYVALAGRWPEHSETFQALAEAGEKHKTQLVRTYQETISDAYEASYSFEGLDLERYAPGTELEEGGSLADDLARAIALEERAAAFYREVSERSRSLLATIPAAFRRVARQRQKRKRRLEALLRDVQAG